MSKLSDKQARMARLTARLREIDRTKGVVANLNKGKRSKVFDDRLAALQAGIVQNIVGNEDGFGLLPNDPDLRVRFAEQRANYNLISELRDHLLNPDTSKTAEEAVKLRDEIDALEKRSEDTGFEKM